jgi:hypothetical protein
MTLTKRTKTTLVNLPIQVRKLKVKDGDILLLEIGDDNFAPSQKEVSEIADAALDATSPAKCSVLAFANKADFTVLTAKQLKKYGLQRIKKS